MGRYTAYMPCLNFIKQGGELCLYIFWYLIKSLWYLSGMSTQMWWPLFVWSSGFLKSRGTQRTSFKTSFALDLRPCWTGNLSLSQNMERSVASSFLVKKNSYKKMSIIVSFWQFFVFFFQGQVESHSMRLAMT